MRDEAILITGAAGEIGSNLIQELRNEGVSQIVALDLNTNPHPELEGDGLLWIKGDILNCDLIEQLDAEYDFTTIFHLASILSTAGEKNPERTHEVNVTGSMNLLHLARLQSARRRMPTKFIFPSTIAAYGLSAAVEPGKDLEEFKLSAGKVREGEFLDPVTMYGVNKLAVEHLGRYHSRHFQLLNVSQNGTPEPTTRIDFRSVRLPGVLSANTLPSGGTSDYAPEMVHSAAQGSHYECFTKPSTIIPFMTMPDAVRALMGIAKAPRESLTRNVYNVVGFASSARDLRTAVLAHFPEASISFRPNALRVSILDSWPADVDDAAAQRDWGWKPTHDLESALAEYMVPAIRKRYESITNEVRQQVI